MNPGTRTVSEAESGLGVNMIQTPMDEDLFMVWNNQFFALSVFLHRFVGFDCDLLWNFITTCAEGVVSSSLSNGRTCRF